MSDVCLNCGKWAGGQSVPQTWDAVCPHCGQLLWLKAGQTVPCKVTCLTRFGIFVELGDGVEGLVHISELSRDPIDDPSEAVSVGQIVRAKVLRVEVDDKKVGLSINRAMA
jgi:ribosomal protein S1